MAAARAIRVIAVLGLAALLLAGCDTKNIGGPLASPGNPPVVFAALEADSEWQAGSTATLTVTWQDGEPPFTILADMGGGTTEEIPAGTPAVSPFTHVFTLVEGLWAFHATVIGGNGESGTDTGTYEVGPLPSTVSIDAVNYTAGVLTVYVSSTADEDIITVTVTEPPGLMVDFTSKVAMQTIGVAEFHWAATDIAAGGMGDTTITATNLAGATDTTTANIVIYGFWYPYDDLLAVPSTASAVVGEPVTIVVISGSFPPDAPFRYVAGIGVTFDHPVGEYRGFNPGAVGSITGEADGIWADMGAAGFTTGFEWMPYVREAGDLWQIDFALGSYEGTETYSGGPLFNFDVVFDTPGEVHIGLAGAQIYSYEFPAPTYCDATDQEHVWLDYSNEYVPNTITVTEAAEE